MEGGGCPGRPLSVFNLWYDPVKYILFRSFVSCLDGLGTNSWQIGRISPLVYVFVHAFNSHGDRIMYDGYVRGGVSRNVSVAVVPLFL